MEVGLVFIFVDVKFPGGRERALSHPVAQSAA